MTGKMSKILRKIGKKKNELLERIIGGKKSKIGSGLISIKKFQMRAIFQCRNN